MSPSRTGGSQSATREQVATLFPRASRSCLEANAAANGSASQIATSQEQSRHKVSRPKQTKTEAEFERILEARKQRGEIISYEFEAIVLRFAGMSYRPDFLVIEPIDDARHHRVCFFEVKGGFTWEDSIIKFKAARDHFKCFHFEMHQKKVGQWARLF